MVTATYTTVFIADWSLVNLVKFSPNKWLQWSFLLASFWQTRDFSNLRDGPVIFYITNQSNVTNLHWIKVPHLGDTRQRCHSDTSAPGSLPPQPPSYPGLDHCSLGQTEKRLSASMKVCLRCYNHETDLESQFRHKKKVISTLRFYLHCFNFILSL